MSLVWELIQSGGFQHRDVKYPSRVGVSGSPYFLLLFVFAPLM